MSENIIYQGSHMACVMDSEGIATLFLDHKDASVNKFDKATLGDLDQAVLAIQKETKVTGLIIASRKPVFVVGADITEFKGYFSQKEEVLYQWLQDTHRTFAKIEDLPYPTVSAIDGICLGGGMELTLTSCYRICSAKASLGLPETKLGIYPGWGGTIRLPRIIGADNAIEWIAGGSTYRPEEALKVGAVDAVVDSNLLLSSAREMIEQANSGQLNWKKRQEEKKNPIEFVSPVESVMAFESAKSFVGAKAGPHYPAPMEAINTIQKQATMKRDDAAAVEIAGFVKLTRTAVADNLITLFLSDQFNKKKAKKTAKNGKETRRAGVLGAGIMGGGVAYQSASKGVPIVMKDITPAALELGMNEAATLLNKQVQRKKIDALGLAKTMAAITPALSYGEFNHLDIIIEAVVENEGIKKSVLKEVEGHIGENSVLASNTSTISISTLSEGLSRPENFCGVHFFNPVHRMPLVEIIRGKKTSDATISTTVAYATKIGKTPIVVNDCPGFLVNRVLFPYFAGFQQLLADGVDYRQIDRVMERFGWPMGPAYLLDVVGIDTANHAAAVMAQGYPERMALAETSALSILHKANRFGQKNGIGFYAYQKDRKGKLKKSADPAIENLLSPLYEKRAELSDEEIIDRMMLPMINESARCLFENIIDTAMELDLGVLYGLGFPPFRGGVLKYADDVGLVNIVEKSKKYQSLAPVYEAPKELLELAKQENGSFYNYRS